jgi:hypothetical protein
MGSDTAVQPTIQARPTTLGTVMGLLRGVVPTQKWKRPQDLIPTRDRSDWAATSKLVTGISAGHEAICGPGWT